MQQLRRAVERHATRRRPDLDIKAGSARAGAPNGLQLIEADVVRLKTLKLLASHFTEPHGSGDLAASGGSTQQYHHITVCDTC